MNIFLFDPLNLESQAKCHPDKLVVKMQLEAAQLLNNNLPYSLRFYKPTHQNHPCNKWLGESPIHLSYGLKYLMSLINEYELRYNKPSNYRQHLDILNQYIDISLPLPSIYPVAINQYWLYQFLQDSLINSSEYQYLLATKRCFPQLAKWLYRHYLLYSKTHYAEWRYTEPPAFWDNQFLSPNNGRFCRLCSKIKV